MIKVMMKVMVNFDRDKQLVNGVISSGQDWLLVQ
jgi:hypothetical protein